ncbi:2,5-diamino-6-(ribosylamino)-4(3H)-pyrimidinone 5'-phosphate reductase [Vulcanisaeta distributa]|uniref:2,5-diamino-6-(ribosylamino)-4(3H)-pyrimidinone 5'-phosphate reductase n=1 Tax=Vulcanisaeta distributa (strain DSM 14429 / JCM 11212 / NBRC 100878 / IC-017) TaxID=572478 RepID=E1QQA8_VULDI|nr:2,5-diamino-6-(ribosylamino)-4(3H)-pyrimidinone 5'-phosphate reductase [Vulcanisaeta distributa]ADN51595.1 2,5-diamino-6-hydroxy-4-(5-phosphoribosylamino)p yrimidine1-reductase [Vulcanisaeta distributa DSM 14429]
MPKPYVIIVSAASIDGRIASKTGYSRLSCPFDLRRLHEVRASVDAIMVGANTVINDDPSLTPRYVKAIRNPIRVVIDGKLRIPLTAKVVTNKEAPTIIVTTEQADRNKIAQLMNMSVEVWVMGKERINLKDVLERLFMEKNVKRVLVEGGGHLNWELIKEGLVDEIRLTISPYVFGAGTSFIEGEGYPTTIEGPRLRLKSVNICECGQEVILNYIVEGD